MELDEVQFDQKLLSSLKEQDPEKYFQEILEVNEFENLKILVENSDNSISWVELSKVGVIKIEQNKVVSIDWYRDLILSFSNLKKLRKLKKVYGDVRCSGALVLEELPDLKDVKGNLDIRNTPIELQLDIIDKINKGELTVERLVLFGRNQEGIEMFLEQEEIPGDLFLNGSSIDLQIDMLYKKAIGEIKVGFLYLDIDVKLANLLVGLYDDESLNLEVFRKRFGDKILTIEDEEIQELAKAILVKEANKIKQQIKKEGEEIIKKNRNNKHLTDLEKKELRSEFNKLITRLKKEMKRIKAFGIKLPMD